MKTRSHRHTRRCPRTGKFLPKQTRFERWHDAFGKLIDKSLPVVACVAVVLPWVAL